MDILTHIVSGLATGTVAASFSRSGFKNKTLITLTSGLGGALPDLDAISLWSGFDSTIGRFFNLPYQGKEIYSAKLWYSHHGFMHSVFAALFIAAVAGLTLVLLRSRLKRLSFRLFVDTFKNKGLILCAFVLGFTIHLVEDMPTPASTWGGVNFFWPSESYIGGAGDIWWWNNYDIFLIALSVLVINIILLCVIKRRWFDSRKLLAGVFLIGLSLVLYQVKTRNYDFAYSGYTSRYTEFETKSKELQKDILGEKLFRIMERIDNALKIYF